MVTEFKFPDVGEGVTEGTLVKWLVSEGDAVEEDESLAEVETDKAVVEVPSPTDGTVLELKAEEGDTIKVGNVIVTIDDGEAAGAEASGEETEDTEPEETDETIREEDEAGEDEEAESGGSTSVVGELEDADAAPADEEAVEEPEEDVEDDTAEEPVKKKAGGKVLAAPSTRQLAREEGVDITAIQGGGPGGRVTKEDVKEAAGGGGEEADREAGKVLAAPAVRTMAEDNDLDIMAIDGTGPGGRVTAEDVRKSLKDGEAGGGAAPAASPGATFGSSGRRFAPKDYDFDKWGDVEREEMSATRKAIAKQMERSAYTAPHVTATDDADVTELVNVRKQEKEVAEEEGVHLTFLPFIVKAVISALKDYPRLNASLDEKNGEIVKKDYYNIGVAVATDDGLLVPNVKDADQKSILTIAGEIEQLADGARERELSLEQMKGGTFTITNWGSIGGKHGTPILNYPEVGILGTGVIEDDVRMVDGELQVRKVMPLSLSFDHRVVDGAYAAQFMNELVMHLEDPNLLMMD